MYKTNREMDALKQTADTRTPTHYIRAAWRTIYALKPDSKTLAYFLICALLCAITFGFGAEPVSVCLLAVCETSYISACCLGAIVGYGLRWGLAASFELYAILAIVLCARALLPKIQQNTLPCLICTIATAGIGLLFAASAQFSIPAVLRWGIHVLASACGAWIFQRAIRQKSFSAQVAASSTILLGLAGIHLPGGANLAVIALAWIATAPQGLIYVCAGSALLAIVLPQAVHYAAIFCLSTLIYRRMRSKSKIIRLFSAYCVYALAGLQLQSYSFPICAVLGGLLTLRVDPGHLLPLPTQEKLPEHPVQRELLQAAQALTQAAQMLDKADTDQKQEIAVIFDDAAAQVCQNCAKNNTCWQENTQALYEDLISCAGTTLARGCAVMEDFPPRFHAQCLHPEAFVTAVNDALDNARAHRRLKNRLEETRRAAGAQYQIMGSYLERLSEQLYAPKSPINYVPELSVQAAGRGGSNISGDRGAAFAGPDATYYVLLCDGMGTGSAAAKESMQAIALLRQLLLSGLDAGNALRSLNGVYVLRDNGCFSTVDLLRINLTSGDAILYKWGAAPSYLKRHRGLRYLGGATLPPGLGQNEEMEQIRLSLDQDSVLVLLSDGLGGKESRRRLESCESLHPQDVAKSLFVGRGKSSDDCTAVAIRLRHARSQEAVLT